MGEDITLQELLDNHYKDNGLIEHMLIQAIALLSTHPSYDKLTPFEVFDEVKKNTKELYGE